mgnify:FL=1
MWMYFNSNTKIPVSGWKIHIGTSLRHFEKTKQLIINKLLNTSVSFKVLQNFSDFLTLYGQHAPRESAGKLATIYPVSLAETNELIILLYNLLKDLDPGPDILTDYRFNHSQVHVRYGAFKEKYLLLSNGKRVPAMLLPDKTLVEDKRTILPNPKDIFPKPFFVGIESKNYSQNKTFPVTVLEAIRHSTAGGIYLVKDNDNIRIMKEARPMIGYDDLNRDATTRLKDEFKYIKMLSNVDNVINAYKLFDYDTHRFMIMEYSTQKTLLDEVVFRLPDFWYSKNEEKALSYLNFIYKIQKSLNSIFNTINKLGVQVNDISPENILIENDKLTIIDFGSASLVGDISSKIRTLPVEAHSNNKRNNDIESIKSLIRFMIWPSSRQLKNSSYSIHKALKLCFGKNSKVTKYAKNVLNISFLPNRPLNTINNMDDIYFEIETFLLQYKKEFRPTLNPLYSLFEGLGGIIALFGKDSQIALKIFKEIHKNVINDIKHDEIMPGLSNGLAGFSIVCAAMEEFDEAVKLFLKSLDMSIALEDSYDIEYGGAGILLTYSILKEVVNSDLLNNDITMHKLCIISKRIHNMLNKRNKNVDISFLNGLSGMLFSLFKSNLIIEDRLYKNAMNYLYSKLYFDDKFGPYVLFNNVKNPYLGLGSAGILLTSKYYNNYYSLNNNYKNWPQPTYVDNESVMQGRAGLLLAASSYCNDFHSRIKEQFPWILLSANCVKNSLKTPFTNILKLMSLGYGLSGLLLLDINLNSLLRKLFM